MGLILRLLVLSSHFKDVADRAVSTSVTRIKTRHISGAEALGNHPAVRAP
jgi:hypothetical protein